MTRLFLHIYDFLAPRRRLTIGLMLLVMAAVGLLAYHARYEEDIAKFLPRSLTPDPSPNGEGSIYSQAQGQAQSQGQGLSTPLSIRRGDGGEALIAVIVTSPSVEQTEEAIDRFGELAYGDTLLQNLQTEADETQMMQVVETVYANMPYLFTSADSARIDSLLRQPDYISRQLEENKRMLASSLITSHLSLLTLHDPLHLFTPTLQRLDSLRKTGTFQVVDGYVFTADGQHGIVTFESPFGSSETGHNALLAAHLDTLMRQVESEVAGVEMSAVGAPLIAVTNAQQIKSDATLAIVIAVVLIFGILLWHYRRLSDLLWIGVTLGFGFAAAIALTALCYSSISIIVIGIASAIIGIAANYPLHFLDHYKHLRDRRETLREMVRPLLIGNVTTVAAFFCLVFLDAEAMRHLGLFASIMLVGTILFVLVFLPHLMRGRSKVEVCTEQTTSLDGANYRFGRSKLILCAGIVVTFVLGYFSLQTSFDSDLNHINYMTDRQRSDLKLLSAGAIDMNSFMPSADEAAQNSLRWNAFWAQQEREGFSERLNEEAERAGFRSLTPCLSPNGEGSIYSQAQGQAQSQGQGLSTPLSIRRGAGGEASLLSSFNFIGFVCGFVVFAFLWLSFRRIELALLSFLPLAVGWVWILGSMHLLGLQFNIVNVILATFIFGQGDDYTIFITEGLLYEYTYGRRRLDAYRRSVFLSAIIMLVGIGCLVVARHPALQSLGLITIVGMFTVVLMAFVIPPMVFRWLTTKKGVRREVPITLKRFVYSLFSLLVFVVFMLLFMLPFTCLYFLIGNTNERKRLRYHRFICRLARFITPRIPGVKLEYDNSVGEDFERPAIIVSNHQSHLDLICLLMLSPKMVFLTNDWVWRNPLYGLVIHKAEFYPVSDGIEKNLPRLRDLYRRGYSICIFPEGTRSADCNILRFHKGAFYLARQLGADILPVFLHGIGHVLPKNDFMLREGTMHVEVGRRMRPYDGAEDSNEEAESAIDREVTHLMHRHYVQHYNELCQRLETDDYWRPLRKYQNYYRLP